MMMMEKDMFKTLQISMPSPNAMHWICHAWQMHAPHHMKKASCVRTLSLETCTWLNAICAQTQIILYAIHHWSFECVRVCARVYFFATHSPTTRNQFFFRLFMQCGDPTKTCTHYTGISISFFSRIRMIWICLCAFKLIKFPNTLWARAVWRFGYRHRSRCRLLWHKKHHCINDHCHYIYAHKQ